MNAVPPILLTIEALGRRAGVNRRQVEKLAALGDLAPDFRLSFKGGLQPLFYETRVAEIREKSGQPTLIHSV